jgi:uncharacterized protein YkwD
MFPRTRATGHRRLASVALAVVALAAVLAPAPLIATEPMPDAARVSAEESAMVAALNADRAAAGLVAVRTDSRLMAIARARSADMVAKDYFSHTQPDGRNVFDILSAQRITWYKAGEIIAWNNYPLDVTTSTANRQWMDSPGHHAIIVATDFNYVGVGLAVQASTGQKFWTAVFMKGSHRRSRVIRRADAHDGDRVHEPPGAPDLGRRRRPAPGPDRGPPVVHGPAPCRRRIMGHGVAQHDAQGGDPVRDPQASV